MKLNGEDQEQACFKFDRRIGGKLKNAARHSQRWHGEDSASYTAAYWMDFDDFKQKEAFWNAYVEKTPAPYDPKGKRTN